MKPHSSALLLSAALLASCVSAAQPVLANAGSGAYELEKPHSSLVWRVRHMGLSNYTARFTGIEATLDFDRDHPEASRLKAVIDPASIRAEHPTDKNWDSQLADSLFKAKEFPQIVFTSTAIERTGETTGKITGDLSFLGVTKPLTLDVTFNGAISASPLYRGRDVIGFSAHGVISRSAFGLDRYASMVGDDVEIIIEAEFSRRRV